MGSTEAMTNAMKNATKVRILMHVRKWVGVLTPRCCQIMGVMTKRLKSQEMQVCTPA